MERQPTVGEGKCGDEIPATILSCIQESSFVTEITLYLYRGGMAEAGTQLLCLPPVPRVFFFARLRGVFSCFCSIPIHATSYLGCGAQPLQALENNLFSIAYFTARRFARNSMLGAQERFASLLRFRMLAVQFGSSLG